MATSQAAAEVENPDERDHRRDQILEAASVCFGHLGVQRTNIADVARVANLSRATVYRYFEDRKQLVAAALHYGGQKFYQRVAEAMAEKSTLAEQMGAMAQVHATILRDHRTRSGLMSEDTELMRHLITDGDAAVRRSMEFLLPYVSQAQVRGEVGPRVDVRAASEWLARIIYSFSAIDRAQTFDIAEPDAVGKYVEAFAVNGLR